MPRLLSGGNLLLNLNPDFESNVAGTTLNTPLGLGAFGDSWTVDATSAYLSLELEQSGYAKSGLNNLYIFYNGTTLPASMGAFSGAGIRSAAVPVVPGTVYGLEVYSGWDANAGPPAGVQFLYRCGITWYDASNAVIVDNVRDISAAFGRWFPETLSARAPSNAAYLKVHFNAFVKNTGGSPYVWDGTSKFAEMRWDFPLLVVMSGQGLTDATFPLDLPPLPQFSSIKIQMNNVVSESRSPFTSTRQVFEWAGEYLSASVTLPPMSADYARSWVAWLAQLRGKSGTFSLFDTSLPIPRGSVAGAPVCNGTQAAGSKTLALRGFMPNAALVLRSGDWITVFDGSVARLYMNLLDVDADSSGNVTLNLYPRLRGVGVTDGWAVQTQACYGTFALASNTPNFTVDEALIYGIQFDAVEAI